MAQTTVLVCDGCERPTTARKPVGPIVLTDSDNPDVDPIQYDAHDAYCWTRAYRRDYRKAAAAAREANAAAKTTGSKKR